MSTSRLTQPHVEVSPVDLELGARELLKRAEEIAERERVRHKGARRRWSEEGSVCAALAVEGVRRAILDPARENHRYAHRLYRSFPCSRGCLARGVWAVLWRAIQATRPSRDWPIRPMLAALVEQEIGYVREDWSGFADQVARDLKKLSAALAVPPRRRTAAQKRLIATYNVTVDCSRAAAARAEGAQVSSTKGRREKRS
jgi:hypothetical protein